MNRSFLSLCFLGALLLSSCNTRNTSAIQLPVNPQLQIQNSQSTSFFNYKKGQTLTYNVTLSPVDDPLVSEKGEYMLRVEEIQQQSQMTEIVFRASSSFGGKYQYPRIKETGEGAALLDATFLGLGAEEVKGLQIDFLHKNLKVGQRWQDENWIAKVKAQETVVVPAGQFNAWKIEVIGTFEQAYTAVGDYWLVPGKGIVKSVLTQPGWHISSELKSLK